MPVLRVAWLPWSRRRGLVCLVAAPDPCGVEREPDERGVCTAFHCDAPLLPLLICLQSRRWARREALPACPESFREGVRVPCTNTRGSRYTSTSKLNTATVLRLCLVLSGRVFRLPLVLTLSLAWRALDGWSYTIKTVVGFCSLLSPVVLPVAVGRVSCFKQSQGPTYI